VGTVADLEPRALVESLPHIVWVNGPDGATAYLNGKGTELARPAAADVQWSWLDLLDPRDAPLVRSAWERAAREGTDYAADARLRQANGEYRWFALRGSPVRAGDGTVLRWVGTICDIDGYKEQASEAGRASGEATELLDRLQATAPVGFVLADRDFRYVRVSEKMAVIDGAPVADHLGRTPAEVVPSLWPTLGPAYRRVLGSGEEVLDVEVHGEIPADPGRARHWLTSFYPVRTNGEVTGVGVVVIDVTERKEAERARAELTAAAVGAVAAAGEAHDPYTARHQRRVAGLCVAIANEMGLDQDAAEGVRLAAFIHDVGKLSAPAEILNKPGRLSATEFALITVHPKAGHDIVQGINFPWPVADMILQHHERQDGSGYPNGSGGPQICLGARIIAVADTVEAMCSHRPYRPAMGVAAALSQVEHDRGSRLDADVVDACLRLFREGRFTFEPG
jgi:PAS domain S-box-containing protein